jgi:antitoxin component of MazEF toxin-antitoxin module
MWIVNVFRQGHSVAVTIPSKLVRVRRWRPGSKVVWSVGVDGALVLEGLEAAVERSKAAARKGAGK